MLWQRQRPALQHQDPVDLGLVVGEQLLSECRAKAATAEHDQIKRTRPGAETGQGLIETIADVATGNVEGEVGPLGPRTGRHDSPVSVQR